MLCECSLSGLRIMGDQYFSSVYHGPAWTGDATALDKLLDERKDDVDRVPTRLFQ